MGNTASGLEFGGTIEDYEDFDPEEDAQALHKAFHSKKEKIKTNLTFSYLNPLTTGKGHFWPPSFLTL